MCNLLRYVGDVLGMFFWFCPTCLEKLINEIYHDTVKSDVSNDGPCNFKGLFGLRLIGLWFFVGWEQTNTSLVDTNDVYAVSGVGSFFPNSVSRYRKGPGLKSPHELHAI